MSEMSSPIPTRSRRAPTQERSRRTVQQILDAAEQIVGESGVDAATTRAVAERADVAIPSLYRFFADRDEILDALLEQLVADLDEQAASALAAWEGHDIGGLIGDQLDVHVRYLDKHPCLAALWFGGRVSPPVVEAIRARNRALAEQIRAILAQRDLVPASTPVAAFEVLVELADRVVELAFRGRRRPDRDVIELGHEALTAFLERLVGDERRAALS